MSRPVSLAVAQGHRSIASREVSFHVPPADLVAEISSIPQEARAGSYIDVEWRVWNDGGVDAVAPWSDVIGLSSNDVVGDADDVVLWTGPAPNSLGPQAEYGATQRVWIEPTMAGPWHLFVATDSSNQVTESDDANNQVIAPLPLAIAPFTGTVLSGTVLIGSGNRTYRDQDLILDAANATIDGEHRFASLLLRGGSTLTHSAESELGLEIEAQDLWIDADSKIDVSGRGFGPNRGPGAATHIPSAGGSHGGAGGPGRFNHTHVRGYGPMLRPETLGSGGGGPTTAGWGGGLVRLRVPGTLTLFGSIEAAGLPRTTVHTSAGGAGGGVWIRTGHLLMSGSIRAGGGVGASGPLPGHWAGGGGGGRVHVQFHSADLAPTAWGAAWGGWGAFHGGAGTVVWEDLATPFRFLVLDNAEPGFDFANASEGDVYKRAPTHLPAGCDDFDEILIRHGARLGTDRASFGLRLRTNGDLIVDADGAISAREDGFRGGFGPGSASSLAGGGGHGGRGGGPATTVGSSYGDEIMPLLAGCSRPTERPGPGSVALEVGGTLVVDGLIEAAGTGGGVAGGSIAVLADALAGGGVIDASGSRWFGTICGNSGGGGGGGRIAIHVNDQSAWGGTVDVSGGFTPTNCGGWIASESGSYLPVSPLAVSLPPLPLIDGVESFDSYIAGSMHPNAPEPAPTDFSGSWGNAGPWGYPPTYRPFSRGDMSGVGLRIVDTSSFDVPTAQGRSLALNSTVPGGGVVFQHTYVSGRWATEPYESEHSFVEVEARVWNGDEVGGAGIFSVAYAHEIDHDAGRPLMDMGPTLEWRGMNEGGRILAHVGPDATVELVPQATFNEWQRIRIRADLAEDVFDLWWAPDGQELRRVARDVPFLSSQTRFDRFVIGQEQAAEGYFDDLSFRLVRRTTSQIESTRGLPINGG